MKLRASSWNRDGRVRSSQGMSSLQGARATAFGYVRGVARALQRSPFEPALARAAETADFAAVLLSPLHAFL